MDAPPQACPFSVVIPAWNEERYLPSALDHVAAALVHLGETRGVAGETVVVDNRSTDSTARLAAERGCRVVEEERRNIAAVRNRGAREARGRVLAFLDADTQADPALLVAAWDAIQDGAVGGGALVTLTGASWGLRTATECWNALSLLGRLAAGSFLFCRRDAFEGVGGFDERYYAGEEVWLSKALKRWGRREGPRVAGRRLRFVVHRRPRIASAGRKDLASTLRAFSTLWIPGRLRRREACGFWYDAKR